MICIFYTVGCLLCAVFGVLHLYDYESVRGFWLIFAPFPPCLLYGFYRYRLQLRDEAANKPKRD